MTRDILLLSYDLGIMVSSVPAAFNRNAHGLLPSTPAPPRIVPREHKKARSYLPEHYLSITITSHIGNGSVGMVYGGTIECQTRTKKIVQSNVVIKLVFGAEKQDKLRHEYSVYERLATAGTQGIPWIFGLFQDFVQDGPLAMVLSDCGRNLWVNRSKEKSRSIVLLESER